MGVRVMYYAWFAAVLSALAIGFVGGFVAYRQSRRWCTGCGSTLRCPLGCADRPTYGQRDGRSGR
jgi:hypothetical protein